MSIIGQTSKKKQASKIKVEMYGNPNLNCNEVFLSLGFLKYMPFYTGNTVFSIAYYLVITLEKNLSIKKEQGALFSALVQRLF